MRSRRLGGTGLDVSVVSLGSWLTFGGRVDVGTSIRCIRRAFELGVTFFDTANVYEHGGAEEVLGRALAPMPRDRFVVATKVWGPMGPGPDDRGLGRRHVLEQSGASLRRLGLDEIDLYQCHRYDPETPLEETCRVMDELVRAGTIRHWGVSEWTAPQMREAIDLCRAAGLAEPRTDQPRYSMLDRAAEEEVLPACAELGLGVVVFSPLAQGVLTGKYRDGDPAPAGSRAASGGGARFVERLLTPANHSRVERLRRVADDAGLPLAHLAIAWVLRRPEISSAIVGATSVAQIEQNVAAADVEPTSEVLDAVERALMGDGPAER